MALLLLPTWTVACGGGGGPPRLGPALAPEVPVPSPSRLESVFVLESGGAAPEDTVVTIGPGRSRVVILRRAAPDNSLFASLSVGPTPAGADSIRLTIRPRPGLYGLDLEANGPFQGQVDLTISYAIHFVAPAGARARYGSDLELEKALFVAQVGADGAVTFLPTRRPGSDLVAATLAGPGRYLVAAPK